MKNKKKEEQEELVKEVEDIEETKKQDEIDEEIIDENAIPESDLLSQRIKELEDALLRSQAETMNYRKRKDEEVSRMLKYANEDIILDFLNILDNFERAINMDDDNPDDEVSKFLDGMKIIYKNTLDMLAKYGVSEIDCLGKEFDATYHHGVMTDKDETKESGIILEVLQKGYMYQDKVIRPAMVKVNE